MPGTSDVIYLYDGSFEGLLCCVHESVYTHELPVDIQPEEAAQPTLFRQKYIAADEEKAARVYDSIPRKISPDAAALVQCVCRARSWRFSASFCWAIGADGRRCICCPTLLFSRCWPRGRIC